MSITRLSRPESPKTQGDQVENNDTIGIEARLDVRLKAIEFRLDPHDGDYAVAVFELSAIAPNEGQPGSKIRLLAELPLKVSPIPRWDDGRADLEQIAKTAHRRLGTSFENISSELFRGSTPTTPS